MTATLALFDLDHTLLPLDSDHAWSTFTFELGWADAPQFRQTNERMFEAYRNGSVDIREYVRFNTSTMRAREPAVAAAARARFMSAVIEPALRPAAMALVEHHKARGHRTLIVTATNEWITEPIARRFGVDDLIAVRLARDARGYTGEIAGTPSFQHGKVVRVGQWLRAHGLARAQLRIVFYSDSCNDLPLLEFADEPVATNPDERLRAIAIERGWRILDLFADPAPAAAATR